MNLALTLVVVVLMQSSSVYAADDWNFILSPYVWFAGAKGDLSTVPDAPATSIDVSSIDALKGTETSFMLMLEAKKRRHGVLFDIFYSDVGQEHHTNAVDSLNWNASVKDTMVTAGYSYRVYGSSHTVIDLVGGLRYWEVDTRLTASYGQESPEDKSVRNSEAWVDPLAGVDAKVRLGDSPFYLAGFLAVGGAAGGSDSFYDLSANIGYQFLDSIIISAGYRVFDVDYENDAFIYDVKQEGWVLGLVWVLGTNSLN